MTQCAACVHILLLACLLCPIDYSYHIRASYLNKASNPWLEYNAVQPTNKHKHNQAICLCNDIQQSTTARYQQKTKSVNDINISTSLCQLKHIGTHTLFSKAILKIPSTFHINNLQIVASKKVQCICTPNYYAIYTLLNVN